MSRMEQEQINQQENPSQEMGQIKQDGIPLIRHCLKSMSKFCADEITAVSSPTCDERFSSGFLEMRASTLQIIILKEYL